MKTKLTTVFLLAACTLSAGIVNVTLIGVGPSDGSYSVLPYELTVQTGNSYTDVSADCYDLLQQVSLGQSWAAHVLDLNQAVAGGMFSGRPDALQDYELVGILSSFPHFAAQTEIDIQHLMWDIFAPGSFSMDAQMNADLIVAMADISTFDFGYVEYIEPVDGQGQPFVEYAKAPAVATPEPGTAATLGLAAVLLVTRRWLWPSRP